MSVFVAYPDESRAGLARFTVALAECSAKVRRSFSGPPMQFLVEVEDRDAFARRAGTAARPIVTDNAPAAKVCARQG